MQSNQARGLTPAFPGKVMIHTQEARVGGLLIKAKSLPLKNLQKQNINGQPHPRKKNTI